MQKGRKRDSQKWQKMADGAGAYRAKKTKEWHHRNKISILLSWPGYSPDVNPIENCWALMKFQLTKGRPSTIAGVKEVMQQIWNGLTAKYPRSLYASTPGRMQRVIEAEGKQPSTDAWL